jgi:thioredoxin 1
VKTGVKIAVVAALAVAVALTFAARGRKRAEDAAANRPSANVAAPVAAPAAPAAPAASATATATATGAPAPAAAAPAAPSPAQARRVPRLLELGSTRCMACQQMEVVLDALRASQGARLQVDFIDVMEDPAAGAPYKISLIPTQIFYDAAGTEIFRHTGFLSHDDVLAKFRQLGVKL